MSLPMLPPPRPELTVLPGQVVLESVARFERQMLLDYAEQLERAAADALTHQGRAALEQAADALRKALDQLFPYEAPF